MNEYKDVQLGIRGVRTLVFLVNEKFFRNNNDEYNIDFNHQVIYELEKETIIFMLRVTFYYKNTTPDNTLFEIHTENKFQVIDLKDYTVQTDNNETMILLDENAWTTMVSLSISHTRALLSTMTAPTVYRDMIIPLVNPLSIARTFFPNTIIKEPKELKENASIR